MPDPLMIRLIAQRHVLDDPQRLQAGSFGPFAASVLNFTNQCRQIAAAARVLSLPASYRRTNRVVVNGMGGSGLGADILVSTFADRLRCPVTLTHDYTVPGFTNDRTLYLACSYSGNTEEVLTGLAAARQRRAQIAVLTAGGALAQVARRYRLPALVFPTDYNPSGQPRLGLGYSLLGAWAVLGQAGVLPYTNRLVAEFLAACDRAAKLFAPTARTSNNLAKRLALTLHGRLPLVITGSRFAGVAHAFANQCHESAKHFTAHFTLPELNHHLLEGLSHPAAVHALTAVLAESPDDPPAIRRRLAVTAAVFRRHAIPVFCYRTARGAGIAQAGELLQLALYASWYLAALNRVNPRQIPWVDFFKAELAKR